MGVGRDQKELDVAYSRPSTATILPDLTVLQSVQAEIHWAKVSYMDFCF